MTKWIERYQRRAEERYQRLEEVLDAMNGRQHTTTRFGAEEDAS